MDDLSTSMPAAASPPAQLAGWYQLGPFRLDPATHQLLKDGAPVPLGVKAFDALVVLVRNRGRVVTKEELLKRVWPDSFVTEDSLTHIVSSLRRALDDDVANPRYITTVARRGYRFTAPVVEHEEPGSTPAQTSGTPSPDSDATTHRAAWLSAAAALLAGICIGLAGALVWQRTFTGAEVPATAEPLRFVQMLPPGTTLAYGGVLSPDGRSLAFVARDDLSGRTQIWVRSLASTDARPLAGTDDAIRPAWSPDSQSIAFFAESRLKRIALGDAPPQTIARTIGARPNGVTWRADGLMLFADSGSIFSVPAGGGTPAAVLAPDGGRGETALRSPQFLPDGRHFLYTVAGTDPAQSGTFIGDLESTERTRLLDASGLSVTFAPPSHLLYVQDRVLMAQRLDLTRLQLTGEPRALSGNVSPTTVISASSTGVLAFGGGTTGEALAWFDRSGTRLSTLTMAPVLNNVTLARNQRQVLGSNTDPTQAGTWLVDLERDAATRIVADGGASVWSPDGQQIAFTANRQSGAGEIYLRTALDRPDDELLLATDQPKIVNDWSRDGRYIVYVAADPRGQQDIWLLPRQGDRMPVPFARTEASEIQAQVSPDGRWITYSANESGSWHVYIQSFPQPGARFTVDSNGGSAPQWRPDGQELFYLAPDYTLMAVDVRADGGTLEIGRAAPLFRAPLLGSLTDVRNYYTVSTDGRRFLMKSLAGDTPAEPITLVVNWTALAP
jgi:DNA-binding winged helix-turn-helix (wHTH) protein/Tol biopolymer transport system component